MSTSGILSAVVVLLAAFAFFFLRKSRERELLFILIGILAIVGAIADFMAAYQQLGVTSLMKLAIAAVSLLFANKAHKEAEAQWLARLFPIRKERFQYDSSWLLIFPKSFAEFLYEDFLGNAEILDGLLREIEEAVPGAVRMKSGTYGGLDIYRPNTAEGRKRAEEIAKRVIRPLLWKIMKKYKLA